MAITIILTTRMKDLGVRRMKKDDVKKRIEKGKDIKEISSDDKNFEKDPNVCTIQEVNDVINNKLDFPNDEEICDFQQLSENGEDGDIRSRFLEFNEQTHMQGPNLMVGMKFKNA